MGLGTALTLELYPDRVVVDGVDRERPDGAGAWQDLMRETLERCPELKPSIDEIPFNGGLVGATGYDIVRYFERLPVMPATGTTHPVAAYVAPRSLLVFSAHGVSPVVRKAAKGEAS